MRRATFCVLAWSCAGFAAGPIVALPAAQRPAPALGRPITADAAAAWDLTVFPDGRGLPPGRSTAIDGRALFDRRCASCHGPGGRGATADELVTPRHPLSDPDPDKSIGNYWPFATTLFDFIRRAMPMDAPGSLSADEVYALAAYLLYANGVIGEHDEMNPATLPAVRMPNRHGFDRVDADGHDAPR